MAPPIKKAGCDEKVIYRSQPFLVKDVLSSAILVAANEAFLEVAELVGAPDGDRELITDWIERGRRGLTVCWDEDFKLCLDYDLRAARPLRVRTVAGFAPLIAGAQSPERLEALLEVLDLQAFAGHPGLRWPVPPSTSPEELRFHRRSYWRILPGLLSTGFYGGHYCVRASRSGRTSATHILRATRKWRVRGVLGSLHR